jgi:hypothetical protein
VFGKNKIEASLWKVVLSHATSNYKQLHWLGCPVEVGGGGGWSTMEMFEAAIEKGSHLSAMELEPAGQLRAETLEEKVAQAGICPTHHVGRAQARPA